MKKGFTLIELLVVMVIVGILVTIALSKYKVSIEKGRALQGIADTGAISEAVNVSYIKNMNSYTTAANLCSFAMGNSSCSASSDTKGVAPVTAAKYFTFAISKSGSVVTVEATRTGLGAKGYVIGVTNENGEETEHYCTGYERYCKALGAVTARTSGSGWKF